MIFGEDEKYINIYQQIPKYNDVHADEYQEMIKKQIEHIIAIFDLDYRYNSVGGPILTHLFQ